MQPMLTEQATITFKDGVDCSRVGAEVFNALYVAAGVWKGLGRGELVVTSLRDGVHKKGSLHRWEDGNQGLPCLAVDLRTWGLGGSGVAVAVEELRKDLPKEWQVLPEPDHIHLEWDPK